MPEIKYQGQTVRYGQPSDLPIQMPHPLPPRQPYSEWLANYQVTFETLINGDRFREAIGFLDRSHVWIVPGDVPAEKLAAFKLFIAQNFPDDTLGANVPPSALMFCLAGGYNWRA